MDLNVNGRQYTIDVDPNMPLLWVLRDELGLVGTKYGCGIGSCGACKVLMNNHAVQSCSIRVSDVQGDIITIEGIETHSLIGSRIIESWIDEQVAQCGYCQPGQIISALAILSKNAHPDDDIIDSEMAGNLCRCGTYPRIREAIKSAAEAINSQGGQT